MKAYLYAAVILIAFLVGSLDAQIKGPRDYFPKKYPAPPPGGAQPATPQQPDKRAPAAAQLLKFKDLSTNSQFYFISDTNRNSAWTKISPRTAKNSKNGITQAIGAETRVQR